MRSRNVSPGSAVTRTTSQSESTRVPPVTAERSPPDSRMTGARLAGDHALVDRGDPLDDLAVARDHVAGLDEDVVAPCGATRTAAGFQAAPWRGSARSLAGDLAARLAQRRGLRLATTLGDRLGEVAEQHGEPEPDGDREDEAGRRLAAAGQGLDRRARWTARRPPRRRTSPGCGSCGEGRACGRRPRPPRAASPRSAKRRAARSATLLGGMGVSGWRLELADRGGTCRDVDCMCHG